MKTRTKREVNRIKEDERIEEKNFPDI